jgi:hypothetical protein
MGETSDMHIDEEDVCTGLPCSTLEELVIELLELDDFGVELPELEDFDLDFEELDFLELDSLL